MSEAAISDQRPVLVHLSPLPNVRNGIADYAASILLRLADHYRCVCVVEDPRIVGASLHRAVSVMSYEDYKHRIGEFAAERHIGHLGNNPDHVFVVEALSRVPGAVVLHDLTLHYVMERWSERMFGHKRHIAEVTEALHGGRAADLSRARFERGIPVQSVFSEVNCLPLLNDLASSVITHSKLGLVLARAAGFTRPVRVIPHFAEVPDAARRASRRKEIRADIGADPNTVIFASLGFVSANKQISLVLQSLAALGDDVPPWLYVVGGENRDPSVYQAYEKYGLGDRVLFRDYLKEDDFEAVLSAADAIINLRYPTSGETSGVVSRALAHGVPCIVSNHGWYSELPDGVVYKVVPGRGPGDSLQAALKRCLENSAERIEKSRNAAAYAARDLGLDTVADAYRSVIEGAYQLRGSVARYRTPARFVLPPERDLSFEAAGDLEALLLQTLSGERAIVQGGSLRSVVVPTSVADLSSLEEGPEDADLVHAFAAVEEQDCVGGIVLAAEDAWKLLRKDDLLSIALISRSPDPSAARGLSDPSISQLSPGVAARLRRILTGAGFRILRQADVNVAPRQADDGFCRIVLATARKVSNAEPVAEFFQDCG